MKNLITRAFNTATNKWISDFHLNESGDVLTDNGFPIDNAVVSLCTGQYENSDSDTLIFYGDIVELDGKVGYIDYSDAFVRFFVRFPKHDAIFDTYSNIKVIGNIYEDHELLEAQN